MESEDIQEQPYRHSFYEIKTQKTDPLGYSDAGMWILKTHENKGDSLFTMSSMVNPIVGHPFLNRENGFPQIKQHFTVDFQGSHDNYPLHLWSPDLVKYTIFEDNPHAKFKTIHVPLNKAQYILENTVVTPGDWEGSPMTPGRREFYAPCF